jgi:2,5-furandicarboxylate decarboxylase 1
MGFQRPSHRERPEYYKKVKGGVGHMADQSYRSFLKKLEDHGQLIRFTKEVDPLANMAAVEWKAYNEMGKSSLFTNIKGHKGWHACSQILADKKRWAMGLEIQESELHDTISHKMKSPVQTVEVGKDQAPVRQVILTGDEVDLYDFPSMITSEDDGGRYLASGMAIIRDPDTGVRNMSVHRQQVMGTDTTGFIMLPRHARRIYDKYRARNLPLPVAMVYGAHPAIFFSAAFTTSYDTDELTLAGALVGEPIRMVKCETLDLEVPAEAELVVEGEVHPNNMVPEGPYGEVTGTYAEKGTAEIFKAKVITRRKDPIFYALHSGFPVTDAQSTMALGIEVSTKEHLRNVEGGIDLLDVRTITSAGAMMLVIKLRPKVEGQAKTALMAALSGPFLHPKIAVAVDEDIDAGDPRQVIWSITNRVHAERDVIMIPNTRVFGLDKISPVVPGQSGHHRIGTKWMIDATIPASIQGEDRKRFDCAMPKNVDSIDLESFLP